jgi:hypothetical protein
MSSNCERLHNPISLPKGAGLELFLGYSQKYHKGREFE